MISAPNPSAQPTSMTRKPKKGYFVKGQFVAEGSELDLELKRELKGGQEVSKTDLKRESARLQELGEQLLGLRADLREPLALSETLKQALEQAARITDFEGRRRQMQFIGKLMRNLEADEIHAISQALLEQRQGSARDTALLHQAEHWRTELITDDAALERWVQQFPDTDVQQLRALLRQARKDEATLPAERAGQAQRQSRAYRDIFQLIKEQLHA
jgi:ribosome-associated protein